MTRKRLTKRKNISTFKMKQELKIKVSGSVDGRLNVNTDLIFLTGLKMPLVNKVILLKNRIIFVSNLKYIDQKSEVNVEKDNNKNYGIATNFNYEISKYLRFIAGVSYDRFEFRYNPDLNYYDLAVIGRQLYNFK